MKNIMMTTSDLSGQAKSFFVAKKISDGVYKEYYQQGDVEKEMGLCPLDMLDRDKQENIPDDRDAIVLPPPKPHSTRVALDALLSQVYETPKPE
uniref:PDEase domain-containing protein n=1 Tax=Timema tahoe TaxID=61484 RepID=A0A7R9NYX8_9NEOP|nr:unnamed protein product [Timema tahoe]